MKLRELLSVVDLKSCRITINGYCEEEKYDIACEENIDECFDSKGNLLNIDSIVFEPWWKEVRNKEVDRLYVRNDEDYENPVAYIELCNREKMSSSTDAEIVLSYLDELEEIETGLEICHKKDQLRKDEALDYFVAGEFDGLNTEETWEEMKESYEREKEYVMKDLNKYFKFYKDRKELLLDDCEDKEEMERIQNWLDNFEK